jgi:hypothetical protein
MDKNELIAKFRKDFETYLRAADGSNQDRKDIAWMNIYKDTDLAMCIRAAKQYNHQTLNGKPGFASFKNAPGNAQIGKYLQSLSGGICNKVFGVQKQKRSSHTPISDSSANEKSFVQRYRKYLDNLKPPCDLISDRSAAILMGCVDPYPAMLRRGCSEDGYQIEECEPLRLLAHPKTSVGREIDELRESLALIMKKLDILSKNRN